LIKKKEGSDEARLMDLKLSSGLRISIVKSGDSKIVIFDKPVKEMELTKEESMKLGATLLKGTYVGVTAELRNLIDSGFFSEPKSFGHVKTELFMKGVDSRATSLNMLLTKMVERGELKKIGRKGTYEYHS